MRATGGRLHTMAHAAPAGRVSAARGAGDGGGDEQWHVNGYGSGTDMAPFWC